MEATKQRLDDSLSQSKKSLKNNNNKSSLDPMTVKKAVLDEKIPQGYSSWVAAHRGARLKEI